MAGDRQPRLGHLARHKPNSLEESLDVSQSLLRNHIIRLDTHIRFNMAGDQLKYDGQTVVVTGAGGGLGRAYAIFFASRGANVVVNDLGGSFRGEGGSSSVRCSVYTDVRHEC